MTCYFSRQQMLFLVVSQRYGKLVVRIDGRKEALPVKVLLMLWLNNGHKRSRRLFSQLYLNGEIGFLDLLVYSVINAPKIIDIYLSSAPVAVLNSLTT